MNRMKSVFEIKINYISAKIIHMKLEQNTSCEKKISD